MGSARSDLPAKRGALNFPQAHCINRTGPRTWVILGAKWGREFDVRFYLTTYSDLQERFGEKYSSTLTHWILERFAEGRLGVHTYHFRPLLLQ